MKIMSYWSELITENAAWAKRHTHNLHQKEAVRRVTELTIAMSQIRTDESVEIAARAMHQDDLDNGFASHRWGEFPETDAWYQRNARAALNAILEEPGESG
jgi:hypothetical protein